MLSSLESTALDFLGTGSKKQNLTGSKCKWHWALFSHWQSLLGIKCQTTLRTDLNKVNDYHPAESNSCERRWGELPRSLLSPMLLTSLVGWQHWVPFPYTSAEDNLPLRMGIHIQTSALVITDVNLPLCPQGKALLVYQAVNKVIASRKAAF